MLTGLVRRPDSAGAPEPEQVHLQFGADAATQVAVSWAAQAAVARPRLRFGPAGTAGHSARDGSASRPCAAAPAGGGQAEAEERAYTDALTGETVFTYHARIGSLEPGTQYAYEIVHDGSPPLAGVFRTGPRGRSGPFRFTSFGDHAIPRPAGDGSGPHSRNAAYVVDAVERLDPLFHLLNGDLSYANATDEPVATWTSYFANIARSARGRPWMPTPGNHENEAGNGPQGYLAYQTRFSVPGNGVPAFAGNWYAFTAGPVRFIALNNDDICVQDGGFSGVRRDNVPGYRSRGYDPYISGYSGGVQRRWLERELAAARRDAGIDWIVVFMHQVAMSSAHFNGADLGIRQQWLPLFDAYGVDLVLAGHEHHYERTHPVRGTLPGSALLTPAPAGSGPAGPGSGRHSVSRHSVSRHSVSRHSVSQHSVSQHGEPAEVDTRHGTVHLTIGGGGHPYTSPARRLHGPHEGIVIAGVEPGSPVVQRRSVVQAEPAPWSAYRETRTQHGFASFDVAPVEPGGTTSITITYWGAAARSATYRPRDRVVLRKPLRAPWLPDPRPAGQRLTARS